MLGRFQQQILRLRAVFGDKAQQQMPREWGFKSQHAQHAQHAQRTVSKAFLAAKFVPAWLMECLQTALHAVHSSATKTLNRVWVARRVLAAGSDVAGTDSGVDLDVTVNVPSGQSGSAAQSSIEGPAFGPALQQRLSDAGVLYCSTYTACSCSKRDPDMYIEMLSAKYALLQM